MSVLLESGLPNRLHRGKVRETYEEGNRLLLMVATDSISAFDVVLPSGIPHKGRVLNRMSEFWFQKTRHIVPNHLVRLATVDDVPGHPNNAEAIASRAMVVRRANRVDIECVVRGYITGSAWAEYRRAGTVSGKPMLKGMVEGDRFDKPIFTPTTKAEVGHDENLSDEDVVAMVGEDMAKQLADTTIEVYEFAEEYARGRGIILADTKMEFGTLDGELILIDELLTPDSSRFWDMEGYAPGKSQSNFDKQYVRDYLDGEGWNHEPPAPSLPEEVITKTRERYLEAHWRITGERLS
jgi:phosphoribosylaminoimidazole-succinocarboxamide synthase